MKKIGVIVVVKSLTSGTNHFFKKFMVGRGGESAGIGIYCLHMQAGSLKVTKKLVVLR
jgi:hypothetical protein